MSASLKHGFQWLIEQTPADAFVVDKKTRASVLEHMVFKYDFLSENFTLVCSYVCMSVHFNRSQMG